MKILTSIVACLIVGSGAVGAAPLTYDEFPTKWTPYRYGTGVFLKEIRNRVEVSLASNATTGSDTFFGAILSSTCLLSGDFDLQVAYKLLTWPAGNGSFVEVYVGAPGRDGFGTNQGIFIERGSFAPADGGEVYSVFLDPNHTKVATSDTFGKLRLARIGSTVTGYFKQGSSWVPVASTELGTGDLSFAIGADSNSDLFSHVPVRASVDNVVIAKGTLVGASCPLAGP